MPPHEPNHNIALMHFRRAWSRGHIQDILARLTGHSNDLLAYDDIRRKLKGSASRKRELKDIPLTAIVGSVGRYTDFTRQFLPRNPNDQYRWARIMTAMDEMVDIPPIEVYQIGDAYFVLDGNHRVSVAHTYGLSHIQAYVIEVVTRVPFSPDSSPDDLIRKAELADFLDLTNLDQARPQADLRVTNPGQYRALMDDIEDKRRGLAEQGHEVALGEAAVAWHDEVYLPIAGIIRERGLLRGFAGRTETDLYVWISRHRARLASNLGWSIDLEAAADDLAETQGKVPGQLAGHIGKRILDVVRPEAFDDGPAPGRWRRDRHVASLDHRLSADVLVPISGEPASWRVLDQAIVVAQHERGHLNGIHVVPLAAPRTDAASAVREEFDRRCREACVVGNLVVVAGDIGETIRARARWNDLVIVSLAHPPGAAPIERLRSGFHTLLQHCPRPVLAVPGTVTPLGAVLLSYDGSPKATEALFVAAYLALQWRAELTVLTVLEGGHTTASTQARAKRYLESHALQASYVLSEGPVAEAILNTAHTRSSELILIGGYGHRLLLEAVVGGTVDQVLRESDQPVLICR
jgi:nucleotide-binding universal stress UspA family protein